MPLSVTQDDLLDFTFYGSLFRQSLIWGLDPFPISPFFIAIVLVDLSSAMSLDFIQNVSPLSAQRLTTWPPQKTVCVEDGSVHLDLDYRKDPMRLLNSCLDFTQVCFYMSNVMNILNHIPQIDRVKAMTVGQRVSLTLFIKYSYLLGVSLQGPNTESSILDSSHPLVAAFRKGLLDPPFETSLDLEKVGSSFSNSIPLTDHSTF